MTDRSPVSPGGDSGGGDDDSARTTRTNELGQPVGEPVPGWAPRPAPEPVTLLGDSVRLEPIAAVHADDLYAALCSPGDAALWTYRAEEMPIDRAANARRVRALGTSPDGVTLAVLPTGAGACGQATLMRADPAAGSLEVGGILYGRTLQRSRAATEALVLLLRHVFDDLGYRRCEWKLDALNAPSASAARRLGFHYEGRFRQALVYKGRNRDTDWFAMTDGDFARLRSAYDAWLGPANFDADGRQRRPLSTLTAAGSVAP